MAVHRTRLAQALATSLRLASSTATAVDCAATSTGFQHILHRHITTLPSLTTWKQGFPFNNTLHPSKSITTTIRQYAAAAVITPAIESRLQQILDRHTQLVQQLSHQDGKELSTSDMANLGKELSSLEPIVEALSNLKKATQEADNLQSMISDTTESEELKTLAKTELEDLEATLPDLEHALLLTLLPSDATEQRGVIIEVRAGTGGDEACLFAGDLFKMYQRYAETQGWRFEIAEYTENEIGGCKLASAAVSGSGVYGHLRFESGVHRVQRVPATESSGRVHTSAASVVVLPEAEDVEIEVRDEDLRIDVYRAGGAGGQHVNTTNSAVRVTHIPTGLAVAIQDERSQHRNKAKALKVLRARLYDIQEDSRRAAASKERREQSGSGDRSERVRTYNYPQGRVTDHRVGVTEHGMEGVMNGEKLDRFIEALRVKRQTELLANIGAD